MHGLPLFAPPNNKIIKKTKKATNFSITKVGERIDTSPKLTHSNFHRKFLKIPKVPKNKIINLSPVPLRSRIKVVLVKIKIG